MTMMSNNNMINIYFYTVSPKWFLIDLDVNLNFKEVKVIDLSRRSLLIKKILTNKADNIKMYLTL